MVEPQPDIARIESLPLRLVVADMLRTGIVEGRLRPGTPIVEAALAEQLNVSRAPVREAIQILEADGLIDNLPYKGKRVKPLTAKSVEEIYSIREQFEAFAVRRIIDSGADVSPLNAHVAAMFAAADAADLVALIAADAAFHRTLIRLADHGLLLTLWDHLALRIRQIMALRNRANADLRQVAANHPPIVDALTVRDLDRVLSLVSQHSRSASEIDLKWLEVAP
ncbi:GntR family transcriptional regulator [Rhizobium straminoryzae]|uniref:GntR family transcriptional regulator n=1 Tax=Rhizobium straminoryzae TaxID=1387186 RepID=A0A549TFA1_9HYPH|nr:GntR family transcriptional regulator [Rhizobium straminoryzae]TRL41201.1 GntR family transcriptional regulator [Rhizobium straminoryzae]